LRERFDAMIGNPKLGPELDDYVELRAIAHAGRVYFEVSPYYRYATGVIRSMVQGSMGGAMQVNLGALELYGVDAIARVQLHRVVELDAAYEYLGMSSDYAANPLDFVPHHRAEGTLRVAPDPRVLAFARVHYIASQIDGSAVIPAYTLVDVTTSVELTRTYRALLRVDDLLDRRPEIRNGYHAPGRVITLLFESTWQ
jgi:outer membrane cobalamin receptor